MFYLNFRQLLLYSDCSGRIVIQPLKPLLGIELKKSFNVTFMLAFMVDLMFKYNRNHHI